MKRLPILILLVLFTAGFVFAQRFRGGGGGGGWYNDHIRTAREVDTNSTGTPMWENPPEFAKDVFTFARIRYSQGDFGRSRGGWSTDLPDSDLNFSYRLQQMTSIKADPEGRIIDIMDPDLMNFPFIYIVEPGRLYLKPEEITRLRDYLLNGGFLMMDDFWGEAAWANVARVFQEVFPERRFIELPLEHPLYSGVFPIKEKGQIPAVERGERSQYDGITWEQEDAKVVHHRALFDDKGRLMVLATHNTDNGDGWEREGEYEYYFRNFSEKIAYPLGINIIFHVMTH